MDDTYRYGIPFEEVERRLKEIAEVYKPAKNVRFRVIVRENGKITQEGENINMDKAAKILDRVEKRNQKKSCLVKVAYGDGRLSFEDYEKACETAAYPWKERG